MRRLKLVVLRGSLPHFPAIAAGCYKMVSLQRALNTAVGSFITGGVRCLKKRLNSGSASIGPQELLKAA